jgi:hypothetical protein
MAAMKARGWHQVGIDHKLAPGATKNSVVSMTTRRGAQYTMIPEACAVPIETLPAVRFTRK